MKLVVSKAFDRPRLGMETGRGVVVADRQLPKAGGVHPFNKALPVRGAQEPPLDFARGVLPIIECLGLYRGPNAVSIDANLEPPARIEATTLIVPSRRIGFEKPRSRGQLSVRPKANSDSLGIPHLLSRFIHR